MSTRFGLASAEILMSRVSVGRCRPTMNRVRALPVCGAAALGARDAVGSRKLACWADAAEASTVRDTRKNGIQRALDVLPVAMPPDSRLVPTKDGIACSFTYR